GHSVQEELDAAMANQSIKQFTRPEDIAALAVSWPAPTPARSRGRYSRSTEIRNPLCKERPVLVAAHRPYGGQAPKRAPMTRINCVPVQELSGPHLVAEYRELPRVFGLAAKAAARGAFTQPATYTLGKGHLLFFYTRLGYLARRHAELIAEMKRRGYKPSFAGIRQDQFPGVPAAYWQDWE